MELLVGPPQVDYKICFHEDFLLEKGERTEQKGTDPVEEKENEEY